MRKYNGDIGKVVWGTSYACEKNGEVRVRDHAHIPEELLEVRNAVVDVSDHYVDYPKFGECESFLKGRVTLIFNLLYVLSGSFIIIFQKIRGL